MKKILIILGSLVIIALGVWFFFFRDTSVPLVDSIKNGLPFGSGEDINIPAQDSGTVGKTTPFDQQVSADAKIFRISNFPVAGFVAFTRGTDTVIRYVDRATGHIFDMVLPKAGSAGTLEKITVTNNTLPKIYEAYFRADGNAVLLRSLSHDSDTIENMTLTLTPPKTTSTGQLYTVSATNLRGGIDSVVVGQGGKGNTLFYTLDTGAIVSSTFTGSDLKTLFTSAFTDLRLSRLGGDMLLYTKASGSIPGYAYNLSAGTLSKLLGPLNGLTAIANANGKKLLYSYVEGNTTKLFIKDLGKKTNAEILPVSLAEKCVWSSKQNSVLFCGTPISGVSGQEPDNWYRGKTHFTDYIWRFDTDAELAQLIADPKTDFRIDLDVSEPKVSPNDEFLIFINKTDLTLWAVRLQ